MESSEALKKLIHDDEILTPTEVAELLYVDRKTVGRWARKGKLPCITTPGGHRRYRWKDIKPLVP